MRRDALEPLAEQEDYNVALALRARPVAQDGQAFRMGMTSSEARMRRDALEALAEQEDYNVALALRARPAAQDGQAFRMGMTSSQAWMRARCVGSSCGARGLQCSEACGPSSWIL